MTIDEMMNIKERRKTVPVRPGQLSVRRQRIERWAHKGRSTSMNNKAMRSAAILGTSLIQKQSESALFQADRRLNMDLFQLGEQREKLLEQYNFDQKLFANKQALLHKDNQDILRTLDYVRKCCKYSTKNDNESEFIDSTIFFEENHTHSQSLATNKQTNAEKSVRHNKKHIESSNDDENSKRQVQFQMNTKQGSQSAHLSRKTHSSNDTQSVTSNNGIRTINSAPPIITIDHPQELTKVSSKLKRPSSRIFSTKKSLQEFRHYPDKFLSKSNRYLPLLRRQAAEIEAYELSLKKQRTQSNSDGSDLAYDDAKSFLSEEIEGGLIQSSHIPSWDTNNRRNTTKLRAPNKINLMETSSDNNTSEYRMALSRFRDREYAHLQSLIRSNSMEHILQPFSLKKTLKNDDEQSIDLKEILHSIDSLNYSTKTNKHKQKKLNLSKLGILIF